MVDVSSDGLPLLFLDVDEGLQTFLGMPAANKMSRKLVAHLIEGEDGTQLQHRVPVPCCSHQSGWESSAQDGIWRAMEQHHCLEGLQVVNWIRGPVVALELGELEVRRDWLLHDH